MFFRVARFYLRAEWLKAAAAALAILLYLLFCLTNMNVMPLSYEYVEAQYGADIDAGGRLSNSGRVPAALKGLSLSEAHEVLLERNLGQVLTLSVGGAFYLTPVLAALLALLLLSGPMKKRRLAPPLAAGGGRGTVYLFLTVLYFGFMLLIWLVTVPFLLGRYAMVISPEEQVGFRALELSLLLSQLFGASLAFFSAIFLRRVWLSFLAPIALWYLLIPLSGLVPLPILSLSSLAQGSSGLQAGAMVIRYCITAAAVAAAIAAGWLHFRRQEQA